MDSSNRRTYTLLSDAKWYRHASRRSAAAFACLFGAIASIYVFRLRARGAVMGTEGKPEETLQAFRIAAVLLETSTRTDAGSFRLITNRDGTISLTTLLGKYVTAQADGTLTADSHENSMWEHFEHQKINESIILKSWHGKYVQTRSNGYLMATGESLTDTARLREVINMDASISLITSHRKFITVATRGLVESPLAKFKTTDCSNGVYRGVALQSSKGAYLSVNDVDHVVTPSSDSVSEATCFSVDAHEDGRISLQTSAGKYVTAEVDGGLTAASGGAGSWERFKRFDNPDGSVSLQTAHQTFVDTAKLRSPPKRGEVRDSDGPTIFCFSYTMTSGAEWDTIREQFARNISIFACNDWGVFSLDQARIGNGVRTTAILGPPARVGHQQGGALILNTDVFLRCWGKVKESQQWRNSQWTAKVDVDSVFFPGRLRQHLDWKGNPWKEKHYFKNCKQFNSAQGPLEVYSQAAVEAFYQGETECKQTVGGQYKFGEDIFMNHCMDLLGISPIFDWDLVSDQYCHTMPYTCACGGENAWKAALHPCKSASTWLSCHKLSIDAVAADAARKRKENVNASV